MIKKERMVPLGLQMCEALIRRLPEVHSSRALIEKELAKYTRGYRGEKALDYYLNELPKEYDIYHDLRLPMQENVFVQYDTIIVTPKFLYIMEVKNYAGTIEFDSTFQQLIRVKDNEAESFADPFLQLQRQKRNLAMILQKIDLDPPIETSVVIPDPSTIIKSAGPSSRLPSSILRPPNIPLHLESLMKKHRHESLTKNDRNKLSRYFRKWHTSLIPNLLSKFQILKTEIKAGVHCPNCSTLPIKRHPFRNTWYCEKCEKFMKHAHLHTLKDYALLMNERITNQECKRFLGLESAQSSYRILRSLKLEHIGANKNRQYALKSLIEEKGWK